MDAAVTSAFIGILPQLILLVGLAIVGIAFRKPLGQVFDQRVTSLSAFGFKVDLKADDIEAAVKAKAALAEPAIGLTTSGHTASTVTSGQVADRAARLATRVVGRTILWVDDHPENNRIERRLLNRMGVFVEAVTTNVQALVILGDISEDISVVISDIDRGSEPSGLELVAALAHLRERPPLIYYVGWVDPDRGTPPGAFGIASRPDDLLNLVLDAFERMPTKEEKGS